jgi:phage major head subunit gpT-like protein
MIINTQNLAALFKGYRVQFLEALQGAKPFWPRLAMKTTSTAEEEIYAWLGAVPGLKKLVGEIVIRNLASHRYGIVNEEFESTVAVPQKTIERDTFGVYNPLFSAMGLAAAQHPDELLAAAMVAGFTTECYTGKNFFDTDHEPVKGKVKFTNKGTKKLSQANYRIARKNIKSRLNAEGRAMNLGVDLVLIVSPTYESTGREIVIADTLAAGGKNVDAGTARLEVWPQLAAVNEDAWFLIEAGHPVKPFIFQEEKAVQLASLTNMESDHVFKKHEFLYQAYGRHNVGYALPELAYGSDGSQAA